MYVLLKENITVYEYIISSATTDKALVILKKLNKIHMSFQTQNLKLNYCVTQIWTVDLSRIASCCLKMMFGKCCLHITNLFFVIPLFHSHVYCVTWTECSESTRTNIITTKFVNIHVHSPKLLKFRLDRV